MRNRLTPIARSLRKRMSDAELLLWKILRGRQLEGLKFRRQQPIGPFIVDFVCFERKLIVDADGGRHYEGEQRKKDMKRDAWLREQGFEILRFSNIDILTNMNRVVERILQCVAVGSHSVEGPSPFEAVSQSEKLLPLDGGEKKRG